ncbi:MAG TPA: hypothetical protein VM055_03800 [Novosphingobium sp.]|nr:hypothetical protein [Novosphingobium sp.]
MDPAEDIPRKRAPLAAHRWFAGIVALWCAAALGLSSLALAPAALERLVAASALDRVIAAASPPLGPTARLLLALGCAGLGGLIGLTLGLRLAARARGPRATIPPEAVPQAIDEPPHLRARDRHPDAPARRPLSASSELDFAEPDPTEPVDLAKTPERRARSPLSTAALESLGLVQLTERLAIAMCERRVRTQRFAEARADQEPVAFPGVAMRSRG